MIQTYNIQKCIDMINSRKNLRKQRQFKELHETFIEVAQLNFKQEIKQLYNEGY